MLYESRAMLERRDAAMRHAYPRGNSLVLEVVIYKV